jgi:hypothetical protein
LGLVPDPDADFEIGADHACRNDGPLTRTLSLPQGAGAHERSTILECEGNNNGGTAWAKALRISRLEAEPMPLEGTPLIAVLGGIARVKICHRWSHVTVLKRVPNWYR